MRAHDYVLEQLFGHDMNRFRHVHEHTSPLESWSTSFVSGDNSFECV